MQRNYFGFRAFSNKHPDAFSVSSLRWLRFNRETNGFAPAFVNVGRRVLIDEDRFFECIARLNGQSVEPVDA